MDFRICRLALATMTVAQAVYGQAALAQPVTYDAAIAAAREEQPLVTAGELRVAGAQRAAEAADELPDPQVITGITNIPVNGPVAFELDPQLPTQIVVGLEQNIPNLAKRHARRALAEAQTGVLSAMLDHTRHHAAIGAGEAWVSLWFAQERAALARRGIAELQIWVAPARQPVASGTARPAQTLAIRRALVELRDVLSEIEAQQRAAQAQLARYITIADPTATGTAPSLALDSTRLRATLPHNPEVETASARQRQALAAVEVAEADKRPDFGVDVRYGRRDGHFGDAVSVMGSITLPIFAGRRQQPRIDAAELEAAAALAERDDALRLLQADFEADLALWRSTVERWQRARDELLPLAQQRKDLEIASYAAGRANLIDVIAANTALIELELEILEREAAAVLAATRLRLTYVEHGR